MAGKSKKKSLIINILPIVFSIIAIALFLFLDAICIEITQDSKITYNGLKVVFGYTKVGITEVEIFKFSVISLIVVIATAVNILTALDNKLLSLIAGIVAIAVAIAFIFVPQFAVTEIYNVEKMKVGIGAILACVSMAISAIPSFYVVLRK